MTIIMADLNAKIRNGRVAGVVGNFGLGSGNDRGDRVILISFCQEHELTILKAYLFCRLWQGFW